MTNKDISKQIKLFGELLELHNENPFKVKSYINASFQIGRYPVALGQMNAQEIEKVPGVGKNMAPKIHELLAQGHIAALEELIDNTPNGILDLMTIKGLGPAKIKVLWKEHHIDNVKSLWEACKLNQLEEIKGFGTKTQQKILEGIEFKKAQEGKLLYAEAEVIAQWFITNIKQHQPNQQIEMVGALRRKDNIIEKIELLIDTESPIDPHFINQLKLEYAGVELEIHTLPKGHDFSSVLFVKTATAGHLKTLDAVASIPNITEEERYQKINMPYIIPEMRNGLTEWNWAKKYTADQIIKLEDIKGIVHNHSTYSDGVNTLEEMAQYCKDQGFEYFGIADHSKVAVYANGLNEDRVFKQHQEIDSLNQKLAPFKVLKGIECDILLDGSMDFSNDILKTFDYVVASVHTQLNMDIEKATNRLLRAIENPYTHILGHLSGRLLLKREGYPLHYDKIIDACIANKVIIEINANPYRLDMDWSHVYDAMEKGALFSINPDAHKKEAIWDIKYGVDSARKSGLLKTKVANTFSCDDFLKAIKK